MNWKNRLTNYNFWISIISAMLLILQAFKIEFDVAYINEILTGILGLLVVIGIISDPTKTVIKETQKIDKKENKKEDLNLPIKDENESDNIYSQVDFQAVVDKISSDLNEISHKLENNTKTEVVNSILTDVQKEDSSVASSENVLNNQLKIEIELKDSEVATEEENKKENVETKTEVNTQLEDEVVETQSAEQENEIPTHYNIVN